MAELLTIRCPEMRDSRLSIDERISSAQDRISKGHCIMRIPAEATDPDIVLADCKTEIQNLRDRLALMQRAIDWCLENNASRSNSGDVVQIIGDIYFLEVPAEFAEIIKPKAGETK